MIGNERKNNKKFPFVCRIRLPEQKTTVFFLLRDDCVIDWVVMRRRGKSDPDFLDRSSENQMKIKWIMKSGLKGEVEQDLVVETIHRLLGFNALSWISHYGSAGLHPTRPAINVLCCTECECVRVCACAIRHNSSLSV